MIVAKLDKRVWTSTDDEPTPVQVKYRDGKYWYRIGESGEPKPLNADAFNGYWQDAKAVYKRKLQRIKEANNRYNRDNSPF